MHRGNILVPIVIIVGAIVVLGALGYASWKYFGRDANDDNVNQAVTNQGTNVPLNSNTTGTFNTGNVNTAVNNNVNAVYADDGVNTNTAADITATWQTYTNDEIGYSIKYPTGWLVAVVDEPASEDFEYAVKYITVTSPNEDYFLALGVKKSSQTYLINNRTGVGAGDFAAAGTITIAGTTVTSSKLVYQGKMKEWYASPNGPANITIGTRQVNASISSSSTAESLDMTDAEELTTAKQILQTLTFTQ